VEAQRAKLRIKPQHYNSMQVPMYQTSNRPIRYKFDGIFDGT